MPPWPDISKITEILKGAVTDEGEEPSGEDEPKADAGAKAPAATDEKTPAPAASPEAKDATHEEPKTETPKQDAAAAAAESPSPELVAGEIRSKGARAFIESLPEDVRKAFGEELYKGMHRVVAERDKVITQLIQRQEERGKSVLDLVEKKFDELLTSGMSDEDKTAYLDKKKLERLEAQTKTRESEADEERRIQAAVGEWWRIVVHEGGLPPDPNDPTVKELWNATYEAPDFDTMKQQLRARLAARKAAPKSETAKGPDLETLVNERAEKLLDKKLKELGLLKADTGRPGSSGGGSAKKPRTMAEASELAMERLRSR